MEMMMMSSKSDKLLLSNQKALSHERFFITSPLDLPFITLSISPMAGPKKKRSGYREGRENKHSQGSSGEKRPRLDENDLERIVMNKPNGLYLILDCLNDPHNLGAILRTADGAGVDAVIAPRDKAVGITDTVRRISVGAADSIPYITVTNLARAIDVLKEYGVWIVGTSDKATQSLYDVDLKGGLALITGSEEKGMRRLTEEACDHLVSLPMAGSVPCLNASVSTGICLYEAVRQRQEA